MDTRGTGPLKSDINVTPLVDVMLVVLIIFMVVTPLLQNGVSVLLPRARNVSAVPTDASVALTVTLKENGEIFLGNESIDPSRLLQALQLHYSGNPALQLQIKADRNMHYGDVRKIIRLGREAGFSGGALVAEQIAE